MLHKNRIIVIIFYFKRDGETAVYIPSKVLITDEHKNNIPSMRQLFSQIAFPENVILKLLNLG